MKRSGTPQPTSEDCVRTQFAPRSQQTKAEQSDLGLVAVVSPAAGELAANQWLTGAWAKSAMFTEYLQVVLEVSRVACGINEWGGVDGGAAVLDGVVEHADDRAEEPAHFLGVQR